MKAWTYDHEEFASNRFDLARIALHAVTGYLAVGWLVGQLLPYVYQALDPRLVDALSLAFEGVCVAIFGAW